jgi:virginiamycin A acetyltransferase
MPAPLHPDPEVLHPLPGYDRLVFLKNAITRPNIVVGDYTYFDATGSPDERAKDFQANNVLYHFEFIGDRLCIGSFCCIASKVRFLMNGASHAALGVSAYPFPIFGQGWEAAALPADNRGDTVVGNDVWIGYGAIILPGRKIGHGAVVGAGSLVSRDVPPYHVVGGNPARTIRPRFSERDVERLLALAWWDWPRDKITRNLAAISGADLDALERCA